jgi:hypothetical protein
MLPRALMRLLVAALVLTMATPARAAANIPLQRAEAAYRRLDFDKVLPLLNEARVHETTPAEYERIVELTAFVHAIYGHTLAARDAFVELLDLNADYRLPADASPKMRDALSSAIATRTITAPNYELGAATPAAEHAISPAPPLRASPSQPTTIPPASLNESLPQPLYTRWWFWTAAGVVAAGIVTTTLVLHNRAPASDFGPYQVR